MLEVCACSQARRRNYSVSSILLCISQDEGLLSGEPVNSVSSTILSKHKILSYTFVASPLVSAALCSTNLLNVHYPGSIIA